MPGCLGVHGFAFGKAVALGTKGSHNNPIFQYSLTIRNRSVRGMFGGFSSGEDIDFKCPSII
jgi:hypothetical protein